MSDFIVHTEFGYDVDDFDFEIIELGDDDYSFDNRITAHQVNIVRVNEKIFNVTTSWMNADFLKDWGYNQKTIDECKQNQIDDLKFQAILKYVNMNSSRFKRKLKLEKINKKCGN